MATSVLAVIAITALATARMTPMYTSSAQLFVSTTSQSASDAYQGGLFSTQRVTSYAKIATSRELSQEVVDRLGVSMSATALSKEISAVVSPDTVLMRVSVTASDPRMARRLAAAVAQALTAKIAELETPPGKSRPILKATVTDPPVVPATPSSPQPARNLAIGALLGLLVGVALAALRDAMDTTVKSADDAAAQAGAPVVVSIGFDPQAGKRPLITSLDSHAPRVEAFRVLRTNLQFVDVDSESKAFVVTSSVPQEGKSTTATNLALALAQADQRVLLIDADLRRPRLASLLDLEPSVGLTTVLVGRIGFMEAMQELPATGLTVMTSGSVPPNPAELLQSAAMQGVLDQARANFDITIIDAPPLLPVTDAALLSVQADGALLVVRYGKTTRDEVKGSAGRLASVDSRAVGIVFNMVDDRHGGYGYSYGYGYGYGPDQPGKRRRIPLTGRRLSSGA